NSVHDLDFQGPSLQKRTPLSRLVDLALRVRRWMVEAVQWLHRTLFPRRAHVYGPHKDSTVVGHVTFAQKMDDEHVPIHHMRVELWARTWWLGYRKLGEAYTGRDGRFRIPYDLLYARSWWIRRTWVELYTTGNHRWEDGRPVNDFVLFHAVKIRKGDLVGMIYDVGLVQLFYWEYDHSEGVPRVVIKDHDEDAPQSYAPGRVDALERQLVPIEVVKMEHLAQIDLDPGTLTIPMIQADYPENLTVCMERHEPGSSRSDAWFGRRMMNGMYASEFDRDPEDPELLWVHHHWSSYERTDDYAIPNVDVWFRLGDDGLPRPVKIRLTGALNAYEVRERPPPVRELTPDDEPEWTYAKRVVRVSGGLGTELMHHFAATHVNTEQYAIAAYRNLRLSPLTTLLFPHVKDVALVDHTANRILIKKGYIQRACALTPRGIDQVVRNTMGTLDWKGFRPMKPVSEAHVYARAANLFWDVVADHVEDFVEDHAEEIRRHWYELYRFSRDAVQHSVPAFLCGWLRRQLHEDDGTPAAPEDRDWYLTDHRIDLPLDGRPEVRGERRAVSPVTEVEDFEHADPGDWKNLKQLCTYVIFQATFGHTWANSKQYDDIGEVLYCSLGLRFGDGPDGVLAPESDYRIAPDLTRSTQMMWWSNVLSRTGYGFLTRNEDDDIPPGLIEKLESRRRDFAALGMDIDQIQSRTNI
ncbi:MAG: lipoxygenase family protein, partial [Longimicrobiales bacterium]|nr:lipoxygenase family protein [Longimicrobiales bacterium]